VKDASHIRYPVRLFLLIFLSIFLSEFAVMTILLRALGRSPDFLISLLDAFLLVVVLFPILLRWIYRPLASKISACEKSEEEFRRIFESSPYSILAVVGETGTIVQVNPLVEKLFGYSPNELLGQKIEILVPERFRGGHVGLRQKYMEKPVTRQLGVGRDLVGRRKDGSEVPVEIALSPMTTSDGRTVILSTLVDISTRKAIELERDLALKTREELVGIVSHEIKNPLSTITSSLYILRKKLPASSDQVQIEKLFDHIQAAVQRTVRITSDLLDVTKIDFGRLIVQKSVNKIENLINESIESFRLAAAEKSITLNIVISPECEAVLCDRDRVVQVLSNLISNAIKFTEERGLVRVEVSRVQDRIRFQVTDNGPGIPADQVSHIFERFWQAKHKHYVGVGLGLYIAQNIMAAHGSEISVNSREGEGSTFWFTLPVAKLDEKSPGIAA